MQKVQAKGPYFLAGHCFGGRVAYEMARQLEASGETVGMLFMLDASAPFFDRNGRRRGERRGPRTTSRWGFFARYFFADRDARLGAQGLSPREGVGASRQD